MTDPRLPNLDSSVRRTGLPDLDSSVRRTGPASAQPAPAGRPPLSRRGFLALAGGTGASLALSGCGGLFGGTRTVTDVTTVTAPAQFQSDPDLRPPVIDVARRPADPGDDL